MKTEYQPRITDRNQKIRKVISQVRQRTRLDKALIAERMMNYSVDRIGEIFPELKTSKLSFGRKNPDIKLSKNQIKQEKKNK